MRIQAALKAHGGNETRDTPRRRARSRAFHLLTEAYPAFVK
jgi:hypothetical protein